MRKFQISIIIIIFVIILLPMIFFNRIENYRSNIDNKVLTNNPLGDNYQYSNFELFTNDMDSYVSERIGFRNEMIYAYTQLNKLCFQEMIAPLYIRGKEGYVFSKIEPNSSFSEYHMEFINMIEKISNYCKERDIPFVFVFNPSKNTVLQEYLPSGINYKTNWQDDFFNELKKRNINYVDNRVSMKRLELDGVDVFNKQYDAGHWNNEGAFYGVNEILKNLQQFYPNLNLNNKSDYSIKMKSEQFLMQSYYEINDKVPYYSLRDDKEISNLTKQYEKEIKRNSNYQYFQYTQNKSLNKIDSPKTLVFQGSYMNEYGWKFLQNQLSEYIAIHDYQNVINFDYYYNIFKPECVIFEVAEYTLSNNYFDMNEMQNIKVNPVLEESNMQFSEKVNLSALDMSQETGNRITNFTIKNLPNDTQYAYVRMAGETYDLKKEDGCFTVSIENSNVDKIQKIIAITKNKNIVYER